ncbi:MAG: hypothetical protein PHV77_07380 [Candidatus Omnitrophica bacterium]|nr:hypothetical protein [Candidatus Omnitrophota bacterium]
MAKVTGPLMSLSASGKVADAVVFFPWKGRHVVRMWLTPTNKKTDLMGYLRAAMRAIGKQTSKIANIVGGGAVDSKLYLGLAAVTPAGQIWNAQNAKGLMDLFASGGAFQTASMLAAISEYSTHSHKTALDTQATALGLEDYAFSYGYTTSIPAGCVLYFGLKSAYALGASWGTDYTLDPSTAAASAIDAFATAHTA